MSRGISIKRRSQHKFNSISNCNAYEELKQLPAITSHKQIRLNTIFDTVEVELKNVRNDIISVYDIVQRDINLEFQQMEQVEVQLKKSLEKVNHTYGKVLKSRAHNETSQTSSKMTDEFLKEVNGLNASVQNLDERIDSIVVNFLEIDSHFPKRSRFFSEDEFSQHHYPLLFELIKSRNSYDIHHDNNLKTSHGEPMSSANIETSSNVNQLYVADKAEPFSPSNHEVGTVGVEENEVYRNHCPSNDHEGLAMEPDPGLKDREQLSIANLGNNESIELTHEDISSNINNASLVNKDQEGKSASHLPLNIINREMNKLNSEDDDEIHSQDSSRGMSISRKHMNETIPALPNGLEMEEGSDNQIVNKVPSRSLHDDDDDDDDDAGIETNQEEETEDLEDINEGIPVKSNRNIATDKEDFDIHTNDNTTISKDSKNTNSAIFDRQIKDEITPSVRTLNLGSDSDTKTKDVFAPFSLMKTSKPSISTTFENISATDIINAKLSKD